MGAKIVRAQDWVGRALDQVRSPLYRNAFFIMASSVVAGGIGAGFQYAVTRLYLVTADLGYAVTLFSAVSFLAVLGSFGLSVGVTRFLPETEDKRALVNTCLTIVGLTAAVFALVFIAGINLWLPDLGFILPNLAAPVNLDSVLLNVAYPVSILIAAIAIALSPVGDSAGIAMRRADTVFWRTTTMSSLKLVFILLFASFAATRGRLGIFLSMAVPFGIASSFEISFLLPRILKGFRPKPMLRSSAVRHMLPFSLGNYTANVIGSAGNLLIPALILSVIRGSAGAAEVASYYLATTAAGLLSIIPNATFTSFYAEASQKNANRHSDERRAILLAILLLAPSIAIAFIFAPLLLGIYYGASYSPGTIGPFRILVVTVIPSLMNAILGTRVLIRKRSRPIIASAAIGTIVTLALGVILLQVWGLEGLAIGIVLGDFAPTPYLYVVARKPFKSDEEIPISPVPP